MRLLIPLFSPATGTWGGLTRVAAVAEEAVKEGHQVAFCASGQMADTLRNRGYQVFPMPATTMFGLPAPISRVLEERSQKMSIPVKSGRSIGSIWLVFLVSGMARPSYLRHLVEAEIQAARDFQADALFTDIDPGAFLASRIMGLPLASSYASIMAHGTGSVPWKLMGRAIASALASHGRPACTPGELFFNPQVLKIIPSIPELDDTDPLRADVRYVGQLLGGVQPPSQSSFEPNPDKRYVFVYVGTGSISLTRLEQVLPQLFPTDGELACIVGAQSIQRPFKLEGVEFRPYVPAERLLPACDWTICHRGQNTIIQSLLHGVPLIVFPGPIFERRYNAQMLEEAGGGLMGERENFEAEWLRRAMEKRSTLAARAACLGKRIRSFGGAAAAVEAIAQSRGLTGASLVPKTV